MNSGTAAKANRAITRSGSPWPRRWRWRTWLLWALGLCAIAIWIGRHYVHARMEETKRNERYATLLAQDVWNFDAENAARTVRVIADAEQYKMVSVVLTDGDLFVEFPERDPAAPQRAVPSVSDTETHTPIRHDGELLGTLTTRGRNGLRVNLALQAAVLLLAGLLVHLGVQMVANKRNLARLRLNHEITLREEVEARLAVRENELRRAQRLEALGQVAGGVAHDFNNLLTVIVGRLEVARLHADEDVTRNIEAALEAADRAHAMTNRLLAFGRGPEANPRVFDLNDMVQGMLDMLRHTLPKTITLETALQPGLPGVRADKGQLEQVVLNLVVNSRDAMPDGGTIRIVTGLRETAPGQSHVALSVEDTGVGMSEELQARVFEPFFTTKTAGEGTGLGLSTVARIVEQSRAKLELQSAPGQGTVISLVFDEAHTAPAATDAVVPGSEPEPARPARRARVLVVEDDASVRMFVREALEGFGVDVTTARDPKDALRILRHAPERVDLVLSDVVMPHMSGPTLREQARSSHVDVPFVFMSGQAPEDARLALERVLEKPFTAADLRRAVEWGLDAGAARLQRST
jgi:signal transduction histidine kinase/CheY-like chemotaxis protein